MRGVMYRAAIFILLALLPTAAASGTGEEPRSASPRDAQPAATPLRLEGTPQQVFGELGQRYGVRIQVDGELRGRLRLRLEPTDLTTALRVATTLANAFWVEQPDGSILVLDDSRENRQRFEPPVTRTFKLPGRTPEELTEIVRLLRQLLDIRLIGQNIRSGTLTVRDTPRRLAVAEALLEQWDSDRAQVVVETLILEVNSQRARALGILPPDLAVAVHIGAGILPTDNALAFAQAVQRLVEQGVLPPVLLSDRFDFIRGVGAIGVGGGRSQYLVNLPGATLNLSEVLSMTRSLRQVTLRVSAGDDAEFFAGEKFPIVFASFSSSFIPEVIQQLIGQGQFLLPIVPSIQYQDIGLTLKVQPTVHAEGDISLFLSLELDALTGESVNQIPVLTSRKVEQRVRLREGESLLLSGFRRQETILVRTGLPLLGRIPWLGHLFRRTEPRTTETDLLVLLTPRIVRHPSRKRHSARTIHLGTAREFSPSTTTGTSGTRAATRQPGRPAPQPQQQQRPQPPRPPR